MLVILGTLPNDPHLPGYKIEQCSSLRCPYCPGLMYQIKYDPTNNVAVACFKCMQYSPFRLYIDNTWTAYKNKDEPKYTLRYYADIMTRVRFK